MTTDPALVDQLANVNADADAADDYQLPVPDTCRSHSVLTRQSPLGIELARCLDCGTSLAPEKPMPETITLDAR